MLFSTLGLSVLALVGSVAAVPRSRANAPRNRPQNQFRQLAARDVNSNDWCGPIKHGSNITSVEGSWIVPSAKIPSGGSSSEEYWVYQWVRAQVAGSDSKPLTREMQVGIDGVGDCTVLLQGGTGQTVGAKPTCAGHATNVKFPGQIINDKLDIFFWYEFYPAPPVITNQKSKFPMHRIDAVPCRPCIQGVSGGVLMPP